MGWRRSSGAPTLHNGWCEQPRGTIRSSSTPSCLAHDAARKTARLLGPGRFVYRYSSVWRCRRDVSDWRSPWSCSSRSDGGDSDDPESDLDARCPLLGDSTLVSWSSSCRRFGFVVTLSFWSFHEEP